MPGRKNSNILIVVYPSDSTRDAIAEIGAEIGIADEPEKRVKCPKMVFAHYMVTHLMLICGKQSTFH